MEAQIPTNEVNQFINKVNYRIAKMAIDDLDTKHDAIKKEFTKAAIVCDDNDSCCSDECVTSIIKLFSSKDNQKSYGANLALANTIDGYRKQFSGKDDVDITAQQSMLKHILNEDSTVNKFKDSPNRNKDKVKELFTTLDQDVEKLVEKYSTKQSANGAKVGQDDGGSLFSTIGMISFPLLLIAILAFVGYFMPQQRKTIKKIKNKIKSVENERDNLRDELKTAKATIQDLNGQVRTLAENEHEMRKKVETMEREKEAGQERPIPVNVSQKRTKGGRGGKMIYESFYMPVPNRRGNFDDANRMDSFDWTESVYKFDVLDKAGTTAEFSFMNDEKMISRALNNYNIYIAPVCKSSNPLNLSATRITTEKKGKAVMRDGVWEMQEKAIIRYEA